MVEVCSVQFINIEKFHEEFISKNKTYIAFDHVCRCINSYVHNVKKINYQMKESKKIMLAFDFQNNNYILCVPENPLDISNAFP